MAILKRPNHFSITLKILIPIILSVCLISMVQNLFSLNILRDKLTSQLNNKGKILSRALTYSVADLIAWGMFDKVGVQITNIKKNEQDLTFIQIVDPKGKITQSTATDNIGQKIDPAFIGNITLHTAPTILPSQKKNQIDIITPIVSNQTGTDELQGYLWLAIETNSLEKSKNRLTLGVLIISVSLLIVSMYLFTLFLKTVLRSPLEYMLQRVNHIVIGDLTESFSLHQKDELGLLAKAFNTMKESLKSLIMTLIESTDLLNSENKRFFDTVELTTASIGELSSLAGVIANGALNQTNCVEQLTHLSENLNQIVNNLDHGAKEQKIQIDNTTRLISSTQTSLKEFNQTVSAEKQTIDTTSDIVKTLSHHIQVVSRESEKVSQSSDYASDMAAMGGESVKKTVAGMKTINATVSDTTSRVQDLQNDSQQISEIITTIETIAEQTNLLALNAAIEAARAGEHGKGFAVVADEIRKLAEQSKKSTKEIAKLIKNIQLKTENVTQSMFSVKEEVLRGNQVVEETEQSLANIIQAFGNTKLLANSITQSTTEMVQASQTAAENITGLLTLSQKNAAVSGEVMKDSKNIQTVMNTINEIASQNETTSTNLHAQSNKMSDSILSISQIAQSNSALAEEMSASAEELTARVYTLRDNMNKLNHLSKSYATQIAHFKI